MRKPTWREVKIGLLVALTTLALVVITQNTEVVSMRFLGWEFTLSRILLLGGALLLGFAAGYLTAVLRARRSQRPSGSAPTR